MKHDEVISELLGREATDEQVDKLDEFERLLVDRAIPLGFVSGADRRDVGIRHVLDSARAAPHVTGGLVADLGSGAGLPGVVVAILRPDLEVHLVETSRRRLAFLELTVESLGLSNAIPVGSRVEDLQGRYTGALARAIANAARSWRLAEPHLLQEGALVYFGGQTYDPSQLDGLGVRARTVAPPRPLASSGPLVIMSRQ